MINSRVSRTISMQFAHRPYVTVTPMELAGKRLLLAAVWPLAWLAATAAVGDVDDGLALTAFMARMSTGSGSPRRRRGGTGPSRCAGGAAWRAAREAGAAAASWRWSCRGLASVARCHRTSATSHT